MSEQATSQAQQAQDAWKKMFEDHFSRVQQFEAEISRFETQSTEKARDAIDEFAKMSKETLAYTGKLTTEWRKLSLEATRNAFGFWTFKG